MIGTAALAGAPPVLAQSTSDVSAVAPSAIIVTANRATTATKTDTPIIDIPQSIGVVTSDQIAARGAIGLQEALRYSAGVRTEPNGADFRFDYILARGGFSAARYIDGMRTADSSFTPRTEIFNQERIEVLRGPSSVLYGQATAGGLVNSVTKRPEFETHGEFAVQYGSFNRKQAQADVTGPINAAGTLAARLVVVARDAGTQTDFGKDNRIMVAPSISFRPDDRTEITLMSLYQRDRAASVYTFYPVSATLLTPEGERLRWGAYLGEPSLNFYNSRQTSGTVLATHRFSEALSYQGSLRYSHSSAANGDIETNAYTLDPNPFLDPPFNRVMSRSRYDQRGSANMLTVDNALRIDVTTGLLRHTILAGADYLRSRINSQTSTVEAGPVDLYDAVYDPANVPAADFQPDPRSVNTQLGFYVQDQVEVGRIATLLVGVRRDRAVADTAGSPRQVDHATTWRAGITLHPLPGVAPYFSYSQSFLPTNGRDFYGKPFVPQRGQQYEAGVKWQPDRATLIALAAFTIKGSNLVQTDPNNGQNQIQIGLVRSRGIEFEASRIIANDITITASYSYLHARTGAGPDSLGEKLRISAVPTHQASLSGEKKIVLRDDLALRLGGGVRYIGPSVEANVFYDLDPAGSIVSLKTPGFTLVDALAALEWQRWSLSLNATNLLDKHYYGSCSPRTACGPGYERNVVGTLGYRF
ncbi:hypothetical protein NS277_07070 [Novosphingobium barchaimii]|nr:hypothetical protein NS277_07070 [Novosphingobium barchaimii]